MSAEPADPRIAVVASVLSDAHFGDSSEDVRDGFRNLARHALAAADAVITPREMTAEKLRYIARRHYEERSGAVLSPPDAPTEYEQVGFLAFKEGDGFTVVPMGVPPEGDDGWEPVFRRVRDENAFDADRMNTPGRKDILSRATERATKPEGTE